MGIFKLKPARARASEVSIIANLDDLITKPTAFTLHGKEHVIEPLSTKLFLQWSEALADFYALKEKPKVEADVLIDTYLKVFKSVCPTIERKDLEDATQAQIAALYSIILDHCTGKTPMGESEKKKMIGPTLT